MASCKESKPQLPSKEAEPSPPSKKHSGLTSKRFDLIWIRKQWKPFFFLLKGGPCTDITDSASLSDDLEDLAMCQGLGSQVFPGYVDNNGL